MTHLLLLLLGLIGLWVGTELAIRSTLRIAFRHGISHGFLGVTVLAVGTDLPELVVAVDGGLQQLRGIEASGVVLGNALGSCLAQISVVLGTAGLFGYLSIGPRALRRDGIMLLLAIALFGLVGLDASVTRTEGAILVVAYLGYYALLFRTERVNHKLTAQRGRTGYEDALAIAAGLAAVLFSAELVVDHAIALAERFEVRQTLVGIFLIGAGTSLPELALSVSAARKGSAGLSVGNLIGSDTFDLLIPIGVSAVIHPLTVERELMAFDLPMLGAISIAALVFLRFRRGLQRSEALGLITLFAIYAVAKLVLGQL